MTSTFVRDTEWHRAKNGLGVLAGSPLTYFSVSAPGALVLDAIESSTALPAHHAPLTDRLLAAGAIHPIPEMPVAFADITVVIPAFISNKDSLASLTALIAQLHGISIVVVDDCSPMPLTFPSVHVVRHETNMGPAAARNTGLALATTTYVAFVDTDISATADQLAMLAAHLIDEKVGVVAPRVITNVGSTFIEEYESMHSPLDLGKEPAVVRPVSRVSYVPSAVLVARTSTIRDVHAFDASMRVGEDVDLVWRLVESGLQCRYVPSVQCIHAPRTSYFGLLKQRFDYGSSAATLDRLHPNSATPFRSHILFTIPAAAILMGYLFVAMFALVPAFAFVFYSLRTTAMPIKIKALVARKGIASSTTLLARAISRSWWPLFFIASFLSLRLGAMLTFSVLAPPAWGILRYKPRYTFRYLGTRILDNFAYGLGVWSGALRAKKFRCLVPVITLRRSASR